MKKENNSRPRDYSRPKRIITMIVGGGSGGGWGREEERIERREERQRRGTRGAKPKRAATKLAIRSFWGTIQLVCSRISWSE